MKYRHLLTKLHCVIKSKRIQSLCGKEAKTYLQKLQDLQGSDEVVAVFFKNSPKKWSAINKLPSYTYTTIQD